jgi:hypothetical protein
MPATTNPQPHNPISGYERAADTPEEAVHYYHYHGMPSMPYRKADNVGQAPPAGGITREHHASNVNTHTPQNPAWGHAPCQQHTPPKTSIEL